ncbi:SPASM domain-containing protein [Streptomyces sp. NBC_01471]|uniref:SPASM domain-containing protein n=1 Tax=Streptomyces sp. NBC_01471 TaxID=2903879 RepID=UPI00352CA300
MLEAERSLTTQPRRRPATCPRKTGNRREEPRHEHCCTLSGPKVRVRAAGRAAPDAATAPDVSELCGRCFHVRVAVSPDGDVYACILSRHLRTGNVRTTRLRDVIALGAAGRGPVCSTQGDDGRVPAPRRRRLQPRQHPARDPKY